VRLEHFPRCSRQDTVRVHVRLNRCH
jgi:hypothetical protein